MKRLTAEDPETRSPDLVAENIVHLARLFPEAFTEGKINFSVLRELLGDAVDETEEKYVLDWHGKRRARRKALMPSTGTLRPCRDESIGWDSTQNLMIEGDNLEVLKLLQRSYTNKVKLIYIDPPYNTGKDFVYRDNYKDGITHFLKITGQLDGNGDKLCSNTDASGRFHTNWLNMVYPRLKAARALLREDGIIAVSIDQEELSNLQKIMDELWGEENRFAILTRRAMHTVRNSSKDFNLHADYLLVYGRSKAWFGEKPERYIRQSQDKSASYPHDDGDGRGPYKLDPLHARNYYTLYEHEFENGITWKPPSGHFPRYAPDTLIEMEKENRISFDSSVPKAKRYLAEVQKGVPPNTVLAPEDVGFNKDGTRELREVLGTDKVFPQPKPTRLVRYLLQLINDSNAIVLDFFAGSGTTGHAVMAENLEDNGNRRFILVQLPEPINKANDEFKSAIQFLDGIGKRYSISELTKERLRCVSAKFEPKSNPSMDLGFRVFKLDSSNIKTWELDRDNMEQSLFEQLDHIKPGRTEDDIFYEILLKLGYDLCTPIVHRMIAGKHVNVVADGALITCLAETILADQVEDLALGIIAWRDELSQSADISVVFRDSAFKSDVAKTNMTEILKQFGIKDVRSI